MLLHVVKVNVIKWKEKRRRKRILVSAVGDTLALNYLPVPALGFFPWAQNIKPS